MNRLKKERWEREEEEKNDNFIIEWNARAHIAHRSQVKVARKRNTHTQPESNRQQQRLGLIQLKRNDCGDE